MFGSSDHIKGALSNQKAYDRFTQAVIDNAKSQKLDNSLPLDDPNIQAIIKGAFPAQTLKTSTETTIDGLYDWLDGKQPNLAFSVDLSANKLQLANDVSAYALDRLGSLPTCRQIPTETNVFKIDCLPPYIDLTQQRLDLRNSILSDKNLLEDTVLTADNLPKNSKGQTAITAYEKAPQYFKWFKLTPWILLGTCVVLSILIVFLSRTKRQGVRQLASSLVGSGIGLMIAPVIYKLFTGSLSKNFQQNFGGSGGVEAIMTDVTNELYDNFNTLLINIGIQVLAAGIILYIILHFIKPGSAYSELEDKIGVANGHGKQPRPRDKKLSKDTVPVQTSESPHQKRTPSKIKRKYRKIQI